MLASSRDILPAPFISSVLPAIWASLSPVHKINHQKGLQKEVSLKNSPQVTYITEVLSEGSTAHEQLGLRAERGCISFGGVRAAFLRETLFEMVLKDGQ